MELPGEKPGAAWGEGNKEREMSDVGARFGERENGQIPGLLAPGWSHEEGILGHEEGV